MGIKRVTGNPGRVIDTQTARQLVGMEVQAASRMAAVSARNGWPNVISGTHTQMGFRSWNYNFRPVTSLRVWFYNGYTSGGVETGSGGPATHRVAIEYPIGTTTPLYTVVIPDNALGYVDIPVNIPAMAYYRVGGDVSMGGAGKVCFGNLSNVSDMGNGDQLGLTTGYDKILDMNPSTGYLGGSAAVGYHPVMIQSNHDLVVWAGLGDSIGAGVSDIAMDSAGGRGILGRALSLNGPNVNISHGGDRASSWSTAASTNRRALLTASGATRALLQVGTNDFYADAKTRAQVESSRNNIRTQFPGIKFLDLTILPRTSSSDGFKTVVNQAVVNATYEAARIDYNGRLRLGIGISSLSAGTIDVAGHVETSTAVEAKPVINGGVWMRDQVDDGTHPNSWGYIELSQMVYRAMQIRR